MKRGLLGLSLLVFLTQVISAQFFSGYGRFSITDFFNSVDPSTIILTLLFLIFFALIFYATSRIFKGPYGQPNKGIAGAISFAVSSLIIYGLYVTNLSFGLGNIFYDLGFSSDLLYPILALLFLVIAGLLIWKLKFSGFLITFGLFLILLTFFTNIFYEKTITTIIGFVLLIVGLLFKGKSRRVMGNVSKGVWSAHKRGREARRQRTSTRRGVRDQRQDILHEIGNIDRELKRISASINTANRQGNQQQVMVLEQERMRLRQQKRNFEREIRRL